MADTKRTFSELKALYADNSTGNISPQDLRDGVHSWMGVEAEDGTNINLTLTTDNTIIRVDATSAPITLTLPSLSSVPVGKYYIVMKIDVSGNAVTVDGSGAETINGASSKSITTQFQTLYLWNSGGGWFASSWSAV